MNLPVVPMNNHCLIEIVDRYAGLSVGAGEIDQQRGIVRAVSFDKDHITASTGYALTEGKQRKAHLDQLVGEEVYFEQFADTGTSFQTKDGRKWALPYWWRITGMVTKEDE